MDQTQHYAWLIITPNVVLPWNEETGLVVSAVMLSEPWFKTTTSPRSQRVYSHSSVSDEVRSWTGEHKNLAGRDQARSLVKAKRSDMKEAAAPMP